MTSPKPGHNRSMRLGRAKLVLRVAGVALVLLGIMLILDSFLGMSWSVLEPSLPDNWTSMGHPLVTRWIEVHVAAPLVATIGGVLLLVSPLKTPDADYIALGSGIIGSGLCVQGLFPFFSAPGSIELIVRQQVSMLSVCCFIFVTPAGIGLLAIGIIIKCLGLRTSSGDA